MIVHDKSDVWMGCLVALNDGRFAEVVDDHPNHEMVMVKIDGEDEPCEMLVGEGIDPLWIKEVLPQPVVNDFGQEIEIEEEPYDIFLELGIDEHTFDGDICDYLMPLY